MRDAFIARLLENARQDTRITLVVGDLGFGVVDEFAKLLPEQFLNSGVAEQAMIGVAAGMAAAGRKVIVYSIANFPTMRCVEQIRNDVCLHDLDVTVVSVGAGLSYGALGYTHHAVEDISVMRSFPRLTIYSPCDPLEVVSTVDALCVEGGPAYLRLGKNGEPPLHATRPSVGSGCPLLLREGSDLSLFATGAIAEVGLAAARLLATEGGPSVRVLSVPKIKPLNVEGLLSAACGTSAIATLEEHTLVGGFGTAVMEGLSAVGASPAVLRIGLPDRVEKAVGSQTYLRSLTGLSVVDVARRLRDTSSA